MQLHFRGFSVEQGCHRLLRGIPDGAAWRVAEAVAPDAEAPQCALHDAPGLFRESAQRPKGYKLPANVRAVAGRGPALCAVGCQERLHLPVEVADSELGAAKAVRARLGERKGGQPLSV